MPRAHPTSAILRIALFSAALAGFVFAMLLAGSPELHEWAHQDGSGTEHQCLATSLHSGTCDDVTPAPIFTGVTFTASDTTPEIRRHAAPSLFLSCGVFEHAPPAVS
jgi:hypothetical protein